MPSRSCLAGAQVTLPGVHATRTVRLNIEQVLLVSALPAAVGIAEIDIPGVRGERTLVVPESPVTDQPATVVLSAAPSVPACFFHEDRPRCSPAVSRASEDGDRIDRTVTLPAAGSYEPKIWTRPLPGYWQRARPDLRLVDPAAGSVTVRSIRSPSSEARDTAGKRRGRSSWKKQAGTLGAADRTNVAG